VLGMSWQLRHGSTLTHCSHSPVRCIGRALGRATADGRLRRGWGTGELEALSGAVMECQRTASQHDSMMCQLCSHSPGAQSFPVCARCQHTARPTLGVPENRKIKG
jgi:hypothetical protein